MSESLHHLCDRLDKEVAQMNSKPDISPTELERIYKAIDIIKDIEYIDYLKTVIRAMEDNGYSNSMAPYNDDGWNPIRGNRYSYGNSYARSRDSMGRYASHDEGPMHEDEKENLRHQIEEMKAKLDRM